VAVRSAIETRFNNDLEASETNENERLSGKLQVEKLCNMCPACFDIAASDDDKSIAFSMDGNVQHSRFPDTRAKVVASTTPGRSQARDLGHSYGVPGGSTIIAGSTIIFLVRRNQPPFFTTTTTTK
jgi:hypothetical protein